METNFKEIEQSKVKENNDNSNFPPNNICHDCGKQLKWEKRCPDCGILSDFDFSKYECSMHTNTQIKNSREKVVKFPIKEIRENCSEEDSALRTNGRDHITVQHSSSENKNVVKEYKNNSNKVVRESNTFESSMNEIKDSFSKDYKDKCDVIETNFERIEQNKIEENNDNDNYPPNNICYDCGKQLKWENRSRLWRFKRF